MKAFWWFKENAIAGMARPGFNSVHWFDLDFDEAVALGWIGRYSTGTASLESFRSHLKSYVPKIFVFHHLDNESGQKALQAFDKEAKIIEVLDRLNRRSQIFENYELKNGELHFSLCKKRLQLEIDFLRKNGIEKLVTLTEQHHGKHFLQDHFELHHISIEDLNAPNVDQVHQLANVIQDAQRAGQKMAVHCLAGIGRTSTMLMSAHLVLGESFGDLKTRLARQNPRFAFTGVQADFVKSLAQSHAD